MVSGPLSIAPIRSGSGLRRLRNNRRRSAHRRGIRPSVSPDTRTIPPNRKLSRPFESRRGAGGRSERIESMRIEPPLKPKRSMFRGSSTRSCSARFAANRHLPDHRPGAERGDRSADDARAVGAKLGASRAGTGKDQLVEIQRCLDIQADRRRRLFFGRLASGIAQAAGRAHVLRRGRRGKAHRADQREAGNKGGATAHHEADARGER